MANKINIDNYEAYLLDYMEGNLSNEEITLLKAFASQHPELNIDLEELELVELEDDSLKFEGKAALKKSADQLVSDEDYINYIEKTISPEEKNKLDAFRVKYPEINKELNLYQHTIVSADKNIIFEDKQSLKKEPKIIWLLSRQTLSMAAAVTIIVGFIVIFRLYTNNSSDNLYSSKSNNTIISNNNNTVADSSAKTPENTSENTSKNTFTEEQTQQAGLVAAHRTEKKSTSRKNNTLKENTLSKETIASNTVTTSLVAETTHTTVSETSTISAVAKELVKPANETKTNSTFIITEKAFDEDEIVLASNDRANFWQKAKKAVIGLNKIGVKSVNVSDKKSENTEQYNLSVGNISIQKNKFIQE